VRSNHPEKSAVLLAKLAKARRGGNAGKKHAAIPRRPFKEPPQ
jgi:hypothetical protein